MVSRYMILPLPISTSIPKRSAMTLLSTSIWTSPMSWAWISLRWGSQTMRSSGSSSESTLSFL